MAMTLVFLLSPGAAEATENIVHIATGHGFAHAAHEDDHHHDEPTTDEHGCSATFHSCGCCATVVPFAVRSPLVATTPDSDDARVLPMPEPAEGHGREPLHNLLRPPIG
jgi:hypothetical protein